MSHSHDRPAAQSLVEPLPAAGVAAVGLEKLRTKLLDLTLANRLLSFRHTKRSSLRVVDELPDALWKRLRDGDELLFLPVPAPPPDALVPQEADPAERPDASSARGGHKPALRKPTALEHARTLGLAVEHDLPEPAPEGEKIKVTHRDTKIQTLLYPPDLEASLRTIASGARTSIEETGTNMLHLVFGFLEWFEDDTSEKPLFAPLMPVPVTLRRGDVDPRTRTYRYHVAYSGEDVATNASLQEKLKRDFGVQLPSVEDDENPEAYFTRVREAISVIPRWRVRRQITLSLLSFGKLLMVRDLEPARWPPGAGPLAHPRALELFEGIERTPYEIGREYHLDDPAIEASLPSLVLDADSSQHSALVDALNGRNLVIQGPPGTGKSQTITNLIAAALVRGKTVLFVAEKLAALEVVRRRLDAVGLGLFCLELHSHKTQKMEMLRDVRARLEARGTFQDPAVLNEQLQVWRAARDELASHTHVLHAPHGALGWTAFEILWGKALRRHRLGAVAQRVEANDFPDPTLWGLADLEAAKGRVATYGRHLAVVVAQAGSVAAHPWHGVTRVAKHADAKKQLLSLLGDVHQRARELAALVGTLRETTAAHLESSYASLSAWLPEAPMLASHRNLALPTLLARLREDGSRAALEQFCSALERYAHEAGVLRHWFAKPERISQERIDAARQNSALLARVASAAPQFSQLEPLMERLAALPARVSSWEPLRARVASILGTELPPTVAGLAVLGEVLAAAGEAPVALLHLRNPSADIEATEHAYRAALQEAQAIWELGGQLSQQFELSLMPSAAELTRHLGACVTAGPLRFLSSEYQDARRCFGMLCRTGAPDDPEAIARGFQALASYAARVEGFAQHPQALAAIGPAFQGMSTPFQEVTRVRAWVLRLKQALAWWQPGGERLVQALAFAPADKLRALASTAPDPAEARARLRNLVQELTWAVSTVAGGQVPQHTSLHEALAAVDASGVQLAQARAALIELSVQPSAELGALSTALQRAEVFLQLGQWLDDGAAVRGLLGEAFSGASTPSAPPREALDVVRLVLTGKLPPSLHAWLLDPSFASRVERLAELAARTQRALAGLDEAYVRFASAAGLDLTAWLSGVQDWRVQCEPEAMAARAVRALDQAAQLPSWEAMLDAASALVEAGLGGVRELADAGVVAPDRLWDVCEYAVYARLAAGALQAHPQLARFDGLAHEQVRERFRRYDEETITRFRQRAASLLDQRPVPVGTRTGPVAAHTDLALLENECKKQRRHIPIRQLVRRAGAALQALKPCFMMGPRAVAHYLDPQSLSFDLLVMDEASQLRPEDALGAVCRAKQVVVVGDPKQLPPTSFFDRLTDPDEIDEEEATTFDDAESILDVVSSVYSPVRQLRWHYRSRHETLIAFSNRHFYEDNLVVFPSPHGPGDGLGVGFELVAGAVYHAGRNEAEAERVVDAIVAHLRESPDRSLGVAAMNFKQRDLIEELLYRRLKDDEQARGLLDAALQGPEPLFVKNLENVQGDERDVIFISVTYGRGGDGRLLQRFGPLNGTAGPRRLNVLFTRAKRRVVVFCSFTPEELVLADGASEGARVLKGYLSHARERSRTRSVEPAGLAPSEAQAALALALQQHGFRVSTKVGVGGAFMDLAVHDPHEEGSFLLGIMLDGPDYRAAFSVRDRDRLRPASLAALGWQLHAVWTPDWHRDPAEVVRHILTLLPSEASRELPVAEAAVPSPPRQLS